jgi:hypothetical protein
MFGKPNARRLISNARALRAQAWAQWAHSMRQPPLASVQALEAVDDGTVAWAETPCSFAHPTEGKGEATKAR